MACFGADPGGARRFGLAALHVDGRFETRCCSSVDEAVKWIDHPEAVGIDCPLWWSSAKGGGRQVDSWLRSTYGIHPGTVQSVNSLRGAILTQGILLAMRLRARSPSLPVTETHPKALLKALRLSRKPWKVIADRFGLDGNVPPDEHEFDALLGAVAAREGMRQSWSDLSICRGPSELDPNDMWFGPVNYWWPKSSI